VVVGVEELAGMVEACNHLAGKEVDREALLVSYLRALDHWYDVAATDRTALQHAWRAQSATLGRHVRVDLGAEEVEGTAVDIDDVGRLVVETLEGQRRTLAVGDVVHLRPR
jgi:BirA family biotin operon repressor/biotin-[acetyl-CoA-carboxylase] ligase